MEDQLKKEIREEFDRRWIDNEGYNIRGNWIEEEAGESIKSFLDHAIDRAREEERELIRWSWDIADGTGEWCVQIWHGNTLIDSITPKSDDGGMGKLIESLTPKDKE